MKSAVTRSENPEEEIEEDEQKKEKAETIIQPVKEQEPTQAVLQSVTTPSKVNFKKPLERIIPQI
jgi:hypothetical protein